MVGAKALIPKDFLFNPDKILRAVDNALEGAAEDVLVDFETTVRTWSSRSKPDFEVSRGKLLRTVFTTGEIYGYVNEGTAPHIIRPKAAKVLAFKVPYSAKTAPRVIGSKAGGNGPTWAAAKEVQHPGFEGRQFDEVIQAKWLEQLPKILQRSIDASV